MNLYNDIETENLKLISITEDEIIFSAESITVAFLIDDAACEPVILKVKIDTHKLIQQLAADVPHMLMGVS